MNRKNIWFSLLFTAMLCANLVQINSRAETMFNQQASLIDRGVGVMYILKAQYDSNYNFIGCWGQGYSCIAIPISDRTQLTISKSGVHVQ